MIDFALAELKFKEFLKKKGRSQATLLAYAKDINQVTGFIQKNGRNLVHEVTKEDLEDFLKALKAQNYTSKSISRKINSIRTFFKFLKLEATIKEDPSKLLEHPKLTPKDPRILSSLEYRALRDTVKSDIRTASIMETFLQTGLRISELANLKFNDVVLNGEKQSKIVMDKREIPLNNSAIKALNSYLSIRPKTKAKTFFVTKTGKPLLVRNIRATLDRYFKKTGIPNASVNDFRHTFIVSHLKAGASLLYISRIVGHKRISTTEKYLNYVDVSASKIEKMELGDL